MIAEFAELGTAPVPAGPGDARGAHARSCKSQIELWKPIIEAAGVTAANACRSGRDGAQPSRPRGLQVPSDELRGPCAWRARSRTSSPARSSSPSAWPSPSLALGVRDRDAAPHGPGVLPAGRSAVCSSLLGVTHRRQGLRRRRGEASIGTIPWRAVVLILGAIVFFGLTVRGLGFVPSLVRDRPHVGFREPQRTGSSAGARLIAIGLTVAVRPHLRRRPAACGCRSSAPGSRF